MVSLAEAQAQLTELKADIANISASRTDIRTIEASVVKIMSSLRQMTGSDEISQALMQCQHMLITLKMIEAAYHAVTLARMAAGDPLAWISAGATVFAIATDVGASLYSMRGTP